MSLARRWEGRLVVRKRLRNGGDWIREPSVSRQIASEDEGDESDEGPPLNSEFLASNTEILYEMFDEWGWKPKPTVPKIQREAGNNLSTMQNLTRSIVMFFWGKFLY